MWPITGERKMTRNGSGFQLRCMMPLSHFLGQEITVAPLAIKQELAAAARWQCIGHGSNKANSIGQNEKVSQRTSCRPITPPGYSSRGRRSGLRGWRGKARAHVNAAV